MALPDGFIIVTIDGESHIVLVELMIAAQSDN
jgi:hypothetical protein